MLFKKPPFKDPIAVKSRTTSKDFVAPTKEQATTGRFMQAGDDYGVGHRTPVGTFKASSIESGPIPFGCKALNPDEI
jgi:hypothetical protein